MATPQDQLAAQLQSKSLPVSSTWLNNFVAHQRNIPITALTQTALFRILNSDFRESLNSRAPNYILPVDIFDPNVQERRLTGSIPLQVLDIEDIGTSVWGQIEAIERVERGEAVRGREIVRAINVGGDEGDGGSNSGANTNPNESNGPHRLILQDAKGTKAVGIEMARINGIGIGKLPIGGKLLLRNATVARGMILLSPENVSLLGGKIEAMDQAWKSDRKARLLQRVTDTGS